MITANEIRQKYLKFFKDRGHTEIPSAPLVPENDPTTLFTSSGMQPLVPNLLGQPHPSGKRLVNSQKCFRAQDIDEVGDNRHTTFFEMLGNWSLGDYFKEEQLVWFYEFLTKELKLPAEKLSVSVFEGDGVIPRDEESAAIWKQLGIPENRIFYYGVKKNWWSRSGVPADMPAGEPGGPDSEVFYEFTDVEHDPKFGNTCHPNCDCGRFLEIGNSVFMQYQKQEDGSFAELPQKNVDFGGGLERLTAAANNESDIFRIDLYANVIKELEKSSSLKYSDTLSQWKMRIIADHLKAATFIAAEKVLPSNKERGYLLRRLIRRAVFKMVQLGIPPQKTIPGVCNAVINTYRPIYFDEKDLYQVHSEIGDEADKFLGTLHSGIKLIESKKIIDEKIAFDLFQSYGFPFELTQELVQQRGGKLSRDKYEQEFIKHQELSRTASKGMFKGGLVDHSEIATKYHTATHLLHAALRKVLGTHVSQKGSNITAARLRFDFSHPEKLTDDQIKQVEDLVNAKIKEDTKVDRVEMPKAKALAEGAMAFFPEKYPEITSVYAIGDFSKELCGGPHVQSTGEIGRIKIARQEAVSAGVRRIYATALS